MVRQHHGTGRAWRAGKITAVKQGDIKALWYCYTQGEVDFMEVLEVPSPDAMLALSLWYLGQGYGHLRSMPAFEMDSVMAALARVRGG